MQIVLDEDLCEANGVCQTYAPTVFEVTDQDELIIRHEAFSEELRAEVELAIRMCPRQALSLKF